MKKRDREINENLARKIVQIATNNPAKNPEH